MPDDSILIMPHSVHTSLAMSDHRASLSSSSPFVFPRAAGAEVLAGDYTMDERSPTQSNFSALGSVKSNPPNSSEFEPLVDHSKITRHIVYGAPGEKKDSDTSKHRPQTHKSRRRTQYYEEQFSERYKDSPGSVRERTSRDSPIIAELRTNVIMKDEYPLIMDLSQTLAHRYQRPDSSVMVTLEHSACLLLGGTFDPTYILTITALPVHIQPSTNKRNAALLQSFLLETLGVPSHRGIIKFQSIPEENLAMNGTTILGEIERLEKQLAEENGSALKRTMTKASRKSLVLKPKPSLPTMGSSPTVVNGHSPSYPPMLTPVPVEIDDADGPSSLLSDSKHLSELSSPLNRKLSKVLIKGNIPSSQAEGTSSKRDRARKRHTEARPAGKATALPKVPLPLRIPAEPTPKIGKRKSLIAIFKR
ncbi:hypothetical protein BU16DRAFT_620788 [Lophium mytilinum]|uniref:L-dopachrome isomerase n=1 Tax=Lophium mytilinum TaxID=390894 RepID=A0A6A6QL41_9PEZI|nr:hypothetical protein BU16DRAFT_620788 [Lophium mytilinum]